MVKKLSDEKIEKIKQMWQDGKQCKEIEDECDVSRPTIYNYTTKRRGKKLSDEKIEKIKQMWQDGLKAKEISKEFDIDISTVYLHTENSRKTRKMPIVKKIEKRFVQGMDIQQMANDLDIPPIHVVKYLRMSDIDEDKVYQRRMESISQNV